MELPWVTTVSLWGTPCYPESGKSMFLEEAILLICCLKVVKSCHLVGANPLK